ncbi:MAG: TonB-dependent receptor [Candidatus Latescibacterota bacterium]|nr:TonB-dependent receptor [Candidatus Latescibacterota bacterium]
MRFLTKWFTHSLFVALWMATIVPAQESTGPTVHTVDTLTVHALRTPATLGSIPYSVNQIDVGDVVRLEPGLSLTEALSTVPGLLVVERNNLSQGDRIAIRGIGARASFGVRGLRVLVDGIPLTMADGQSQLGVIDLSQLASIDVVRGPASALYGNAAGGVLHLQSAPIETDAVQIGTLIGSDELQQIRLQADVVRKNDQVHIGASHTDYGGFREHAYSRQRTFQARWQRQMTEWRVGVTGHFYDAPWLYNPSSLNRAGAEDAPSGARFFVRQQGAAKQVRHAQLGFRLARTTSTDGGLEIAGHVVGRSLANPIPGRIIDLDRTAAGLRIVGYRRWRADWQTTAGIEFESQSDRREEFGNEGLDDDDIDRFRDDTIFDRILTGDRQLKQDEQAVGIGLFTLTRWHPTPTLTLSAGARVDRHAFDVEDKLLTNGDDSGDRNLVQWSPTFGATYTPSRQFTLFANLATAYLTPTTVELGNRSDGRGGFNPDLDPEHYRSVEAGVRFIWLGARLDGEIAVYQLDLEDMLLPFQNAGSDEVFYRNASEARNRGAEMHLHWQPRASVSMNASLNVIDFVFTDHTVNVHGERVSVDGNEVPAVPPRTAAFISTWFPTQQSSLKATVRHQGRMFGDDLNGGDTGGGSRNDHINSAYTVGDLRGSISRPVDPWEVEVFLGIDNVFDEAYNGSVVPNAFGDRYFEPAPGRTVFGGVRLRR